MDVSGKLDSARGASLDGGLALNQGASRGEAELGVLVIPLEGGISAMDIAGDSANDSSYIGSLGDTRVPLPAAAWLFGTAIVGIIAVSRRRPRRDTH